MLVWFSAEREHEVLLLEIIHKFQVICLSQGGSWSPHPAMHSKTSLFMCARFSCSPRLLHFPSSIALPWLVIPVFSRMLFPGQLGEGRMQKETIRFGATRPAKGMLPLATCAAALVHPASSNCVSFCMNIPMPEGPLVTSCQLSSSRRSGNPNHPSVCLDRGWELLPAHPRIMCHIHHAHPYFVCCVSGFTRSPRATGPPRCSRSKGEPNLCSVSYRVIWSVVVLHVEIVLQAKPFYDSMKHSYCCCQTWQWQTHNHNS